MHAGRHYSIKEVLYWTRRDIFFLLIIALIPTLLYELAGLHWLTLPWVPIALIGTAVAFLVGFKNNASYDRMWEARRNFGAIVSGSRTWAICVRDYITNRHAQSPVADAELHKIHQQLINRHLAWLTALRFQLREPRVWENSARAYNVEFNARFRVAEHEGSLAGELAKYLSAEEVAYIMSTKNKAAQIISLQSKHLKELLDHKGLIEDFRQMELGRMLGEFYSHQGACERIKNFPYPRQFATANMYFIKLFVLMVPFGMLQEFANLGDFFVWLNIPFSVLVSWVFLTMEKIGESTENPFEGSPNDIPMTAMSRAIEIDLREILGETEVPPAITPVQNILM